MKQELEKVSREQNHYAVLGISRDASDDAIKLAYRTLAKRWHPDVCKEPGAEEKFKEIGAAYLVLADPEKRREYNTLLDMASGRHVSMEDFLRNLQSSAPVVQPTQRRRRGRKHQQQRRGTGDPDIEDIPDGFLNDRRNRDSFFDDSLGGIL